MKKPKNLRTETPFFNGNKIIKYSSRVMSKSEDNSPVIFAQTFGKNEEEAEANAKLIAVAPDLLSALENSLIHLERYAKLIPGSKAWDHKTQSLDDHFDEVRGLIKKAGYEN